MWAVWHSLCPFFAKHGLIVSLGNEPCKTKHAWNLLLGRCFEPSCLSMCERCPLQSPMGAFASSWSLLIQHYSFCGRYIFTLLSLVVKIAESSKLVANWCFLILQYFHNFKIFKNLNVFRCCWTYCGIWYIQWWPFSWLLCTSEHSLHRCRCWPRCRCTCKVSLLKLHWYRVLKMLPSFQGLLVSRTQRQVTKKRGMMNDPAVLGCGLNESKKTTNLGGWQLNFFSPQTLGKSSNLTSIFLKWVGATTN